MQYLWNYRGMAVVPYIFLLVATLAQLLVPRMVGNIIDAITGGVIAQNLVPRIPQIPQAMLPTILQQLGYTQDELVNLQANADTILIRAGIAVVVFAVVRGLFAFLQTFFAEKNSQSVAYDLRNELFAKIQKLSFSYHDRNQTGQLMVRATDDVEKVRMFIGQGMLLAFGALVLLVGTLILLLTTNASLTLLVLPILPLALLLFMVFGRVSQPLFTKVQIKLSALNTILQENLAGMRVIKAFTRERSEQVKFNASADALMNQQLTVARLFSLLFPLVFLLSNVGQAVVLYFGGRQIINNTLTLGQWQEFSLYLVYIFLPMAQLGLIITQMSQASASATRIFEILDAKSDVTDKPDAQPLPEVKGRVTFNSVTFRYFSSGEPVLRDVSFEARPGQNRRPLAHRRNRAFKTNPLSINPLSQGRLGHHRTNQVIGDHVDPQLLLHHRRRPAR